MKYNKNNKVRSYKKILIISLVIIAVTLIASGIYFVNKNESNKEIENVEITYSDGINLNPPTEDELSQNDQNKIDKIENGNNSTPVQYEKPVRIQESYYDTELSQVVVKTELYGTDWTKCILTLHNGPIVIERSVGTIYQQPFSICAGFSVTDENLISGNWEIGLEAVKNSGESSTSESANVAIP